MGIYSMGLGEELQKYLLDVSLNEPAACKTLRQYTLSRTDSNMISSPEQVQLLSLVGKLIGAKRGLEIGTFTGYTSLRLTLDIPQLNMVCCDINDECTAIARNHWQGAGVDNRIDLFIAPALETLNRLINEGQEKSFDFAYIDADKTNYLHYIAACMKLVRSNGVIAIDNVLWGGAVANQADTSEDTIALRETNQWLFEQAPNQFDLSMIPIGDGLTLLRMF